MEHSPLHWRFDHAEAEPAQKGTGTRRMFLDSARRAHARQNGLGRADRSAARPWRRGRHHEQFARSARYLRRLESSRNLALRRRIVSGADSWLEWEVQG